MGIADNPLIYDGKVICQPAPMPPWWRSISNRSAGVEEQGLSERSAYRSPALLTLNGRQVVTMLRIMVVLDAQSGEPPEAPAP